MEENGGILNLDGIMQLIVHGNFMVVSFSQGCHFLDFTKSLRFPTKSKFWIEMIW